MPAATPPPIPDEDPTTRAILESIRHVVRALRVSGKAAEAEVGLSGAQLFVLQRLAEAGVASLGELAARTLTHQSSVSVVVQRLVEKKLVARRRAADDARRHELAITLRGRTLLAKAPGAAQERLIDALGALEPGRRQALARDLAEVVSAMGIADAPAALFFEDEQAPPPKPARARSAASAAQKGKVSRG